MSVNTVKVNINGQVYSLTYNGTSGKFEGTMTAPTTSSYNVNAGHYYPVEVEVKDVAGNITTIDDTDATLGNSLKLIVKEKVIPTISINSPGANSKLTTNTPTILFALRDDDSGIDTSTLVITKDGSTTVNEGATGLSLNSVAGGYDGSYVLQSALSDGEHTIGIDVKDFDGNIAVSKSVTFVIDTVAPTLNVTAPANGLITNVQNQNVVALTSDATSSPVTVNIVLNGANQGSVIVDGSGNFSKAISLIEGENTIVITSTDGAGKSTTVNRTVTLDTIAPTISNIEILPNPADAGTTFVIKITANDL